MFQLTVVDSFASAHQLKEYKGQCERLHGHNWRVEVTVEGTKLNEQGLLIDFKTIKEALGKILKELDHTFLNEHPHFKKNNPTSENLALFIYKEVKKTLKSQPTVRVKEVTVWESEKAKASYME
jgi:6-pyruvoyltetrahydropterin/6-carboxytetrahydropterin synthase